VASRQNGQPECRLIRCAIYTRKSTEEGLDQEFNSLDAQREACAAYVLSQRHEGWLLVDEHYDDGGYSGGNMDRPGLKQLLADVQADKVDVIVVYKVDRLTRALSDFAKIVEILDAQHASFVSITQSFNTTTSMGRLTLNVLLSFAQFEREVIGERVRDKIAASKRKGLWMGGPVPLGYDVVDRKLVVNRKEAGTVQHIMHRYLGLGSVRELIESLEHEGVRTKATASKRGEPRGGVPFRRGALYHLLANPIYIGKTSHRGETFEGCHEAIVPLKLWEQVQDRLKANAAARSMPTNAKCMSLLAGLIRDDRDRPMTPDHACKQSVRYRYYRSATDEHGRGRRVPAEKIETAIVAGLVQFLSEPAQLAESLKFRVTEDGIVSLANRAATLAARSADASPARRRTLMIDLGLRVVVHSGGANATIAAEALAQQLQCNYQGEPDLRLPLPIPPMDSRHSHGMRITLPSGATSPATIDGRLITLLIKARIARDTLFNGSTAFERTGLHHITRMARLAYLAPGIVAAILDGMQPPTLTARRLLRVSSLPLDWNEQRRLLGFAPAF